MIIHRDFLLPIAIVGPIGLLFALVGAFLLHDDSGERELASVRALPVVAPAAFASRRSGETVLLEGLIATVPGVPEGPFVASIELAWTEDSRPIAGGQGARPREPGHWSAVEKRTPRLTIADDEAEVRFTDDRYELEGELSELSSGERELLPYEHGRRHRLVGLAVRDRVVVLGRVASETEGTRGSRIDPERVFAGTRTAFLEAEELDASVPHLLGAIFSAVGVIALGVTGVLFGFARRKVRGTTR